MDSRGRAFDNIFNERLWRTVKYEEVFINAYRAVSEAKDRFGIFTFMIMSGTIKLLVIKNQPRFILEKDINKDAYGNYLG
jgi:hypothetical protein